MSSKEAVSTIANQNEIVFGTENFMGLATFWGALYSIEQSANISEQIRADGLGIYNYRRTHN
tara:strand:- start:273 stop:458 length:186 start_codon:yes stop_codon:yes gene_type:complete